MAHLLDLVMKRLFNTPTRRELDQLKQEVAQKEIELVRADAALAQLEHEEFRLEAELALLKGESHLTLVN